MLEKKILANETFLRYSCVNNHCVHKEIVMTATASTTKLPTGTWQLDGVHSTVGFEVPYLVGTFKGQFSALTGQLEVAEDGSATLRGETPVASIRVQDENLNGHLLSPDFFDAERFPTLGFSASGIAAEGGEVVVPGELTIRGVTHSVEARGTLSGPLTDPYGNERVGLVLTTTIDRTAFGLEWNNPLPSGEPALGNDVTIVTDLIFTKAA
jgi:polyisoprenoid-binding protein YceI